MIDSASPNNRGRLVIISNRLPVALSRKEGVLHASPGSGGLVTALAPVLRNRGGLWIGWPGIADGDEKEIRTSLSHQDASAGFRLHPVLLTEEDVRLYYNGFSNEIIWPLFHDLQSNCRFDPRYWNGIQEVTAKFAAVILQQHRPSDFIWVHDYQLMLLGQELRKTISDSRIAFFLHIPFPAPDIFLKLPWRFQILRALLEYDLIGFQTMQDQRNFTQCLRKVLPSIHLQGNRSMHVCTINEREIRMGTFPISIDFNEFSKRAASKEIAEKAWLIHEKFMGQKIVFSLDRLDFTKGIPYRLEAIRELLKKHPEIHQKVTFVQVVIPSRVEIPKYQDLKDEIDRLVGEINSQFTQAGWVPINYIFRSLNREELLANYRTSDIALITSVRDGMNLVAKEYVASNIDGRGILILSEFAGAASQLYNEAFLINPYDIEGVAQTIYSALNLPEQECKKRMRKMRHQIRKRDIFWWVRMFLNAAISKELQDFPLVEEYIPKE